MQENSSPKFADRLALSLKKAAMKPIQLAAKSNVSKGYVSQLLSGSKTSPSIEACKKFSEVLGVSFEWLFDGTDSMSGQTQLPTDAELFEDVPAEDWPAIYAEVAKLQSGFDHLARTLKVAELRARMVAAGRDPWSKSERRKPLRDLMREFRVE